MKNILLLILLIMGVLSAQAEEGDNAAELELDDINLHHFIIEVDGSQREFYSFIDDLDKIIEQEGIKLNDQDYLNTEFIDGICYIRIIR